MFSAGDDVAARLEDDNSIIDPVGDDAPTNDYQIYRRATHTQCDESKASPVFQSQFLDR